MIDNRDLKLEEAYVILMQRCVDNSDTECAHSDANDLLVMFLQHLGYYSLTNKYEEVSKWYA